MTRIECEREINDLAGAMVREGVGLAHVLDYLRMAVESELLDLKRRRMDEFNKTQAVLR